MNNTDPFNGLFMSGADLHRSASLTTGTTLDRAAVLNSLEAMKEILAKQKELQHESFKHFVCIIHLIANHEYWAAYAMAMHPVVKEKLKEAYNKPFMPEMKPWDEMEMPRFYYGSKVTVSEAIKINFEAVSP